MNSEIMSAMGATRNVSMENLAPILSAVRKWIARQPGVVHVEMVARMWQVPEARVTLADGTHIVATADEATSHPAGRAPWLPSLDDEFRQRKEIAMLAFTQPKGPRLPGSTSRAAR